MGARGAASVEGKIVKRKAERNEQNDRDKAPEAQPAAQQPTVCDDRAVHSNLQKRSPAAVFRRWEIRRKLLPENARKPAIFGLVACCRKKSILASQCNNAKRTVIGARHCYISGTIITHGPGICSIRSGTTGSPHMLGQRTAPMALPGSIPRVFAA
jgi:hypothetical protein